MTLFRRRETVLYRSASAADDPKDPASADRPTPDYRAALTGDIRGLRIGIVRHLYEDDITVTPEVRAALEEAYAVFRSLGANLEDVRSDRGFLVQ